MFAPAGLEVNANDQSSAADWEDAGANGTNKSIVGPLGNGCSNSR